MKPRSEELTIMFGTWSDGSCMVKGCKDVRVVVIDTGNCIVRFCKDHLAEIAERGEAI